MSATKSLIYVTYTRRVGYRCVSCDATAPRLKDIPHAATCWVGQEYDFAEKLPANDVVLGEE